MVTDTLLVGGSGGGGGGGGGGGSRIGGGGGEGSLTVDSTAAVTIGANGHLILGGATGGDGSRGAGGAGGAGTFNLSGALDFGSGATFTINPNGIFNLGNAVAGGAGTGTITGLSSVTNDGAINFNQSNGSYTFSTVITGSGSVNQNGPGVTILSGANSYTGSTTINEGTLRAGATNVIACGSAVILSNTSGVIFDLNNFNQSIGSLSGGGSTGGNITLGSASLTVNQATADIYAGEISGSGSVTKAGTATLTLIGTNAYTGSTTVSAGALNIRNATALGTGAAGTSVTSGAALEIQGDIVVGVEGLTLNGTGITGVGALRSISGNNIYGGAITLGSATRINTDADILVLSNASAVSSSNLDLMVGGAGNTVVSGVIALGSGSLSKDGGGTLILSGANTYTGATTINGGTLRAGAADVISTTSALTLADAGGGVFALNGFSQSVGTLSGGGSNGGNITSLGAEILTVNQASSATYSGVFSGTGGLRKTGAGILTLAGGNTFSGTTTIAEGTVRLGVANALEFSAVSLTDAADATLDVGGFSATIGGLTGGGSSGGNIALGTTTLTVKQDFNSIYNGVLSGSGNLIKSGSGRLELTGINTYQGATTISAGALGVAGSGSIAASSGVVVDGTFDISGATSGATVNNLSGTSTSGTVALGTKTLTVVQQNSFLEFAGALSGSGTLIKQGAEAFTLTGNSSGFLGTTQVETGILYVSNRGGTTAGRLGGDVAVASGATLEGAGGGIGGTVSMASGGTLGWTTQGSNIGGLSMGSLMMDPGAIASINLLSPVPAASIFTVTGNATVNGTLNLESAPGYGAGVYRVFTTGGTLTDNGLVLGQTPSGYSFQIDAQATALDVVATTVDTSVQYWAGNGTTRGGGGNWTSGNPWLGANGGYAAWAGQTGVFDGPAGIVYVDGTQTFGTLEFLSTDYQVQAGMAGVLDLGAGGRLWAEGEDTTATVSAPIIGAGALTKIGAGTIVLSGANTYEGGTIIQAGTLEIASDAALGAASGSLTFAGGELETTESFTSARNVVLASTGMINVGDDTTLTLAGTISGAGGLILGSGTLVLSGSNTYQGGTTLYDSTVQVTSDANLGAASGALTFNGGTLATAASFTSVRNVTLNAPTVTTTGDPIPGNGTFDTAGGTALTWSGLISGAGALIKTGAGTLLLGGVNTYTGATTISSGTLALTGAGSIAASSGVAVSATFDISGTTAGASIQALSGTGVVALGGQTLTLTQASGTFAGAISGSGGLTVQGGTQTLSGVSTYSGATTIATGTLALSGAGSIAASSGVVANGTLDISGTNAGASIQSLSGTGSVALGGQTITLTNASGSFSGVISGSGALVLAGGSQTLAGTNLYTGGTTVSAGTLELASSVAAGTGAISLFGGTILGLADGVNIANPLVLSGDVTFGLASGNATTSGPLSGTGSLTYTGGGLISLAGDSSAFAGSVTVDGTLSVNGILGGSLNVRSGGMLKGNGTVGATTVAAGGTIAPGNSIGTLTVNGPLTFAAGSTYALEINSAGQSDLLTVIGTATLNEAMVSVTKEPGSYLPGTRYTILAAQDGVSGTFGTLTQDFPFIDLALSYDPADVYLNVVRNEVPFPSVAVTTNQMATAVAVEALGQGNALYNGVVAQTSAAGVRQAFNALDGEVYPSAMSVLQQESLILRRAVLDRARMPAVAPSTAPLAYAKKAPAGTDVFDVPGTPNAFWAQGFGAWGRIDGNGNAATISGDTVGVIVGYDRTFSGSMGDGRLGFAAGYSSSIYQVEARSSSFSSDNAHVAIYGGTTFGSLGVRFGGAYSWADINASRSVVFPGFFDALTADTSARTGQVFGEVGYGLSFAQLDVEPFAGLAYVNVNLSDFTETGGPAALTSDGGSEGVTYSTLGARMSMRLPLGPIPTVFQGTLAWQHAFNTTPETLFAFAPGGLPFVVSGAPIASDAALIEVGLDMAVSANASLSVFYAGQLAETETNNMLKGSFILRF